MFSRKFYPNTYPSSQSGPFSRLNHFHVHVSCTERNSSDESDLLLELGEHSLKNHLRLASWPKPWAVLELLCIGEEKLLELSECSIGTHDTWWQHSSVQNSDAVHMHVPYGESLDHKCFNRKDSLALNRKCNSTIVVKERWHEILTYNTLVDVVACST